MYDCHFLSISVSLMYVSLSVSLSVSVCRQYLFLYHCLSVSLSLIKSLIITNLSITHYPSIDSLSLYVYSMSTFTFLHLCLCLPIYLSAYSPLSARLSICTLLSVYIRLYTCVYASACQSDSMSTRVCFSSLYCIVYMLLFMIM